MIPQPLENLIKKLAKLPSLGPRSAQRVAVHLLTSGTTLPELQRALMEVSNTIETCKSCGNIGLAELCHICTAPQTNKTQICVIEQVDDLWALERSKAYNGLYHVLGGVVNALDGVGPDDLNLNSLINRAQNEEIIEIILALSASVDGQTTCHLISQRLQGCNVKVSVLAKGIPVGASVDYLDEGTLTMALEGRKNFG